jgi:hypothetical protein
MRTVTTLGLLALSANAVVIKRQGHSHGGGPSFNNVPGQGFIFPGLNFAPPKGGLLQMLKPDVRKAYKVEQIPPQKYKDAKRIKITYGPYKIRATSVGSTLVTDMFTHGGHRTRRTPETPSPWTQLVLATTILQPLIFPKMF